MSLLARQTSDYLERIRYTEHQATLLRELQHRNNNLLTVIQSIAHSSLSGDRSLPEAREAFQARLQSLARASRQLAKSNWIGADLREIVRMELEPFGGRIKTEGPDVTLGPRQTQNLSLALHELATNAAKYGAFSLKSGAVRLDWAIVPKEKNTELILRWKESGGPPVSQPSRQGFGTALLKAVCAAVHFEYLPEGFRCEIGIPLDDEDTANAPPS